MPAYASNITVSQCQMVSELGNNSNSVVDSIVYDNRIRILISLFCCCSCCCCGGCCCGGGGGGGGCGDGCCCCCSGGGSGDGCCLLSNWNGRFTLLRN